MSEEISSVLPDLSDLGSNAVWTVKYLDASGFNCQLSLEGRTGTVVLSRGQLAITKLLETGCKPIEPNPEPIKPSQDKDKPVECPIHKTTMRLFTKDNRTWHAHKLETGKWCTGKGEKS